MQVGPLFRNLKPTLWIAAAVAACAVLGGCAVNPPGGGAAFHAPTALGDLYSTLQVRVKLAVTPDVASGCADTLCLRKYEIAGPRFDHEVAQVGERLARAAYEAYPDLAARIPRFDFVVADKAEIGTASTAGGSIVVLRPVSRVAAQGEALAFVVAREMGHVIARHHDENTATSLIISGLASLVAPVINLAKAVASLYSGATSFMASASVTAASFLGSRALISSYRPRQQDEADAVAAQLLAGAGYNALAVPAGLAGLAAGEPESAWLRGLRTSVEKLSARMHEVVAAADASAALPARF